MPEHRGFLQRGWEWLRAKMPKGIGPTWGIGDFYGSAYLDTFRKQRIPTRPEQIAQFRNAVYACANLNADGLCGVPLKLYVQTRTGDARPKCRVKSIASKKQLYLRSSSSMSGAIAGDADVEEVTNHPLLDLLARPNPYFDCTFLFKSTSVYLDLVGNNYWFIGDRSRLGIPTEIWPVPAHLCFPYREGAQDGDDRDKADTELISYYLFTSGRLQTKIDPEDIIHFRMFSPWEPYTQGQSPLMSVFEHVLTTEKMLSHTQAMLDNQARPDAVVSPAEVIGQAEADRFERRLNSKFRGGGFGGLLVAESDLKINPLGWSPADLAALEVYGVTRDNIYDAFGVPQAMGTKETNLANLQAALQQHARFAIKPRCNLRDETINRSLIPLYDDTGRLFVASDNPVPEDEAMNLQKDTVYLAHGVKTRQEVRDKEGLEDAEWAKQPMVPATMKAVGEDGMPIEPKPPEPPGGESILGGKDRTGRNSIPDENGNGSGDTDDKGKDKKKKKKKDKKRKKDKKKNRKSLLADVLALSEKVHGGQIKRHAAVKLLALEHALSSEEADGLIPRPKATEAEISLFRRRGLAGAINQFEAAAEYDEEAAAEIENRLAGFGLERRNGKAA